MTREAQPDGTTPPTRTTSATLRHWFQSTKATSGSTGDRIHAVLTSAIETNTLKPGSKLGEETLAEIFGVSRTPVREALLRLEAEGLINRDRYGALLVSEITVDQVVELYVVREALDGAAAHLAAQYADSLEIQKLRSINDRMSSASASGAYDDMAELNIQFHSVLAAASRNRVLGSFTEQIHRFVKRFQTTTFQYQDRAQVAVMEHLALIEAIEQRDAKLAEMTARQHMRNAMAVRIAMESEIY